MARKNDYWFDEAEADRVVRFFERILKHTEGRWAGAPFVLAGWQRDEIIRPLFGWKRWDPQWERWVRKFSKAWIEIPRGNGKTELAAGIELELLSADGEYGAEVYAGAEDRDQASIVFRVALEMVNLSPTLKRRLKPIESRHRIIDPRTNSFFRVLPRDRMGRGSHGFKVHGYVIDEVHTQQTNDFMDAMKRGMGKRLQPLGVMITTAGDDPNGPAAEEHGYAVQILEGEIEDPSYFVYMKRPTPEMQEQPFNEKHWHRQNPALSGKDSFLSIETLRQEAREAKAKPSEYNKFLMARLNIWVRQHIRWMPMERWDATASMVIESKLKGRGCFGGLHLTASTDVVAWILNFPNEKRGGHDALYRFWVPEARMEDLDRRTDGRASVWVREGFLRTIEGDVIDYDIIGNQIDKDARRFDIAEVGYHRWGVTQLANELQEAGLEVVPVSSGMASMSAPTKEWERLIFEKLYRHGGNPVMRWMISNVSVKTDHDGNMKIDPKASKDTVTGPIAAVMALDRAIRNEGEPGIIVGDDEADEEGGG